MAFSLFFFFFFSIACCCFSCFQHHHHHHHYSQHPVSNRVVVVVVVDSMITISSIYSFIVVFLKVGATKKNSRWFNLINTLTNNIYKKKNAIGHFDNKRTNERKKTRCQFNDVEIHTGNILLVFYIKIYLSKIFKGGESFIQWYEMS